MGQQLTQFCVLPYAGLVSENRIGPFVFWPWASTALRNRHIPDEALRERVAREISRYVGLLGRPLTTQCLVSVEGDQGTILASGGEENLGAAITFLAFSYLLPVVTQNTPVPEHFLSYISQLAELGKPHFVVSAGLHKLTHWVDAQGVPSLTFQVPREVDGLNMAQRWLSLSSCPWYLALGAQHRPGAGAVSTPSLPDRDVLKLGDRLLRQPRTSDVRRAVEAVRWHNLALLQQETLDVGQRPVAMATAFEILLQPPDREKCRHLCQSADALLQRKGTYWARDKKKRKTYQLSRDSYVLYKLYRWRTKVVHGEAYDIPDGTVRLRGWGRKNLVLVASRLFGRCFMAKFGGTSGAL